MISTSSYLQDAFFSSFANSPTMVNKAYVQSNGFFDGISNANWELYQKRYQTQHRHVDNDVRNRRNHIDVEIDKDGKKTKEEGHQNARFFYRDNYDSEFTCLNEVEMGVAHDHNLKGNHQTPKMLCDPDRIQSSSQERVKFGGNGCLIYIFDEGSGDPSKFWRDVHEELGGDCEIHGFSPLWSEERLRYLHKEIEGKNNIGLHSWGLESTSQSHLGRNNYLTLQETLAELGHEQYTIDVLSLNCDGCEWDVYTDILHSDSTFTQLLMELHGAPYQVNDFFLEMKQHNYVIFHKVADVVEKGGGHNHAYSFIRLAPSFFESSVAKNQFDMDNGKIKSSDGGPQKIRRASKYQRIPRHSVQYPGQN